MIMPYLLLVDFVSVSQVCLFTMSGEGESEVRVLDVLGVSVTGEESFLMGEYVDRIVSPVGVAGAELTDSKLA